MSSVMVRLLEPELAAVDHCFHPVIKVKVERAADWKERIDSGLLDFKPEVAAAFPPLVAAAGGGKEEKLAELGRLELVAPTGATMAIECLFWELSCMMTRGFESPTGLVVVPFQPSRSIPTCSNRSSR